MTDTSKQDPQTDGAGKWASKDGQFRRQTSTFRDAISSDPGSPFPPEVGRYHLIVALACPWAHRALIVRALKGIDQVRDLLPVHTVDSFLGPEGWTFEPYGDDVTGGVKTAKGTGNKIPGHESKKRIRDFYKAADPEYAARCTVPVIWDNKKGTIVNNESSEVIRFLNHAFDQFLPEDKKTLDFYPEKLRSEIDSLNEWVYDTVNNGVYKSGFATTQQAYESNVVPLFKSLDRLEKHLQEVHNSGAEFLIGSQLTEADIRLFTTIVRFDPVYVQHFKCNLGTIRADHPNLHKWLRNLYWKVDSKAFKDTTDFESIKKHYTQSHANINPTRIVPLGPVPDIKPLDA
ncbi:hypothetical protein IE81DRAFT_323153 [Ceraceosorus guamensis]|uniref:Glutathione S-transferase omega-like 2 n=1 Tax=Ceraceosorus guamensis TaxID=1522189 RepID=A0A316VZV6_9BASI|nr:hypothetical protein IE81DRAFT_323153 [Ceraceosorus guamensis]PWN42804.1 hypothetical protein IE81DRAFT_323153 [Ceraceosorus guamensis]